MYFDKVIKCSLSKRVFLSNNISTDEIIDFEVILLSLLLITIWTFFLQKWVIQMMNTIVSGEISSVENVVLNHRIVRIDGRTKDVPVVEMIGRIDQGADKITGNIGHHEKELILRLREVVHLWNEWDQTGMNKGHVMVRWELV